MSENGNVIEVSKCRRYGRCEDLSRCLVARTVNYLVQEHQMDNPGAEILFSLDMERDNREPYCRFTVKLPETAPEREKLMAKLRDGAACVCRDIGD